MDKKVLHTHKDLHVWQNAMDVVIEIYKLTENYPSNEVYGLVSQTRRATVSIPANIAEGRKRGTRKDFCHFLSIAAGSCAELETHLEIAHRLGYLSRSDFEKVSEKLNHIGRMLSRMMYSLRLSG